MIKGSEIAQRVQELLSSGAELEEVLYKVVQENLKHIPSHLQSDPEELSQILRAVQFYAHEAHPEFTSGATAHDVVLLRLLPKEKTERYIQRLKDEASDS